MDSNSQKSGFQLADTRLVSTLANPPYPTAPAQHVEAIGVLKDKDDRDIFAWLTLARSLGRKFQYPYDHAYLTRDQVRAIAALRHCNSNDINAWLHLARTSGTSKKFHTLTNTDSSRRRFRNSCRPSLISRPQLDA